MSLRSRRDTKVPLTKPLFGSRRHCEAGTTMAINDLQISMGSAKLSFSMIHVSPMHFVPVAHTYFLERYLCLADSLGCGHNTPPLSILRILGALPLVITVRHMVPCISPKITMVMAMVHRWLVRVVYTSLDSNLWADQKNTTQDNRCP